MKCNFCGKDVAPTCDWQQGRCPHRSAMIDDILLDNYKARYYNLIKSITNFFKGSKGK
jgi:hypothetical protein